MNVPIFLAAAACSLSLTAAAEPSGSRPANRLTVLDEFCDIYYPDQTYPKLTTPQWIGEEGVEAVLVFAIDDMRDHVPYESYLRPILERLMEIDGRAPVSIMANQANPEEPHLQKWLGEGVSLETHTVDHPCPILDKGNFAAAKSTYDRCVDHFFAIPNNRPVSFRTPCMDGINSASPRLFAEILMRTTTKGNFLHSSSSIGLLFTGEDPELPEEIVNDAEGKPRFPKYLLPGYINYIRNYPYPYVIGNRFWEAPFAIPDDYEASRVFGDKSPRTVTDMKAAIDAAVLKKGIWVMTFHPYSWIDNQQVIELIDHAVEQYGKKIKVLNLREMQERLDKHLLAGQPLRRKDGGDNGVRLLDLNNDGYLDMVVGNDDLQQTRVWNPDGQRWETRGFPAKLVTASGDGTPVPAGVRFGILRKNGLPTAFVANERESGAWHFTGEEWQPAPELLQGLDLDGKKVLSASKGKDRGVRFRDLSGDGLCELIVSNPSQSAVFSWSGSESRWKKLPYSLPRGASIVTDDGLDNGVRFVDFNKDGWDDVIFSNEERHGLWLFVPELFLGFTQGWSREIIRGKRGEAPEIPMIVRGGEYRNNGAWFAMDHMWVQNEDTAKLPDLVDRVPYAELLNGFQPPPKTPAESLGSIQVAPEHVVELVAHEPQVQDPVALDWGADGTLWVVEMRDYPNGVEGKPGAVVKRLHDQDGDGFYETAAVFLEQLNYANGIMPWRDGVLISAAPEILFAEDTNGDGRADKRDVLFTGFVEGNQQHRMNGFELGLDGWVYGANGDSGGTIESAKTGQTVQIRGRDFRFDPDTGAFEAISGQTQYGRRRDDWGNWFGGANYSAGWHYVYPEEYLRRNPRLVVRSTYRVTARYANAGRVFPISRLQQRFNDIGMAGHVTSACSFAPYRDDLLGAEAAESLFTSEPSHNLIHRQVLKPKGVSFEGRRAESEQASEFLASKDPWFRPISIKTGPDGALYFTDMYRLVIEHPEWIPQDVQSRVNLRAGEEMGRIYRVRPKEKPLRAPQRLEGLSGRELAEAMDSPNGWQRDTAHRLLLETQDQAAAPVLRQMVGASADPKVRLQALCALEGLGARSVELVVSALQDKHHAVREQAIRVSEQYLRSEGRPPELWQALAEKAGDPSVRVRYQLAYSLGESRDPQAAAVLARIAARDAGDQDVLTAVLSSASNHGGEMLLHLFDAGGEGEHFAELVESLVGLVLEQKDAAAIGKLLTHLGRSEAGQDLPAWKLHAFASLLRPEAAGRRQKANLAGLVSQARAIARDASAAEAERKAAVRLLGRDSEEIEADIGLLGSLLVPETPLEVQHEILERLAQIQHPLVPEVLLARSRNAGPQIRDLVLPVLLKRGAWTEQLLSEVEAGRLKASELGAGVRQELLLHRDNALRARSEKLFQEASSPSKTALVREMVSQVTALRGEAERGRALFDLHCATCHTAGQAGFGAGPNLAMLYDNSAEQILTAILDPNRAVEDKYRNYSAELQDGEQLSGILLSETGNSITIMGLTGVEQTVPRKEVVSLESSSRSMMPEGFEQFLQGQDLADLVAFIRASTAPAKSFAGNQPGLVRAEEDILRLEAARAEIYGDTLVYESGYGNLGFWGSESDRAAWTVELPDAGEYELWLDWACPSETAGNAFIFQAGEAQLAGKVPATGGWDDYQQQKFGDLQLRSGQTRAILRAEPGLNGFLMDLREVRLVRKGSEQARLWPSSGSARP